MKGDILYKIIKRGIANLKLIYIPLSLVFQVVKVYHASSWAGHFGFRRTYNNLKDRYWWPNMKDTIRNYLHSCLQCQKFNFARHKSYGFLHPIESPSGPFQMIGMDYSGPFPITSNLRYSFQKFFQQIFRNDTHIFCWGDPVIELTSFLEFSLFSISNVQHFHNVQLIFASWFNRWINSQTPNINDENYLQLHAPRYDPALLLPPHIFNEQKMTTRDLWSLQDAVVYLLEKYLSKRETRQKWSIGLNPRLQNTIPHVPIQRRNNLIRYASNDVLSLNEIIMFMYNASNVNINTSLREYFLLLKKEFAPSVSSSFSAPKQLQQQQKWYDLLFHDTESEDDDDELADHVVDDRQVPSSTPLALPSPPTQDEHLLNNSPITNDHSSIEQLTTIGLLPSHATLLVEQQVHLPSQDVIPSLVAAISSQNIPTNPPKRKRKSRRSREARTYRNQESSLRHRRNRYRFELQRQSNLCVNIVKHILRHYQIKFTNVTPNKSVMHIGIKSQDEQQLYEQLLPLDIFL
ncbi:unnamed protein product [Rotaria magnacalcarata]|uniref:Integrase zinc-binding domain-containing protein n=1 Tax=Rotaria magnacalcarata TaxID=392030 RepID=A0A8S2JG05_9BILA|nr:unnamed protein product [Rotaria magnacalcarata]